ncbi:MAG TPA: universal stress protein [Bryobacteraceae bacterium]|nr:universal stress protein [Bryobacteraceae bacterium]
MFPPKRILFPVDFSERCTDAARMVETFAGHFQAQLTLLHVIEPLTYNDLPVDATTITRSQLDGYLAAELKHFDVNRVVLAGESATKITAYAHANNFDLIMLPTHGYGRFRRLMLGSVAAKVLHDADCPVWTGVHMEQVPRLEDISFKKIVCAIDLGEQSCPTLRWATEFAAEFGASLTVVHAVPSAREGDTVYADEKSREKLRFARERVQAIKDCVKSGAEISVIADEVAYAVCGEAGREKADLLVIGRSLAQGMLGRLKANAYSIIRQSPCPVISV